MRVGTLVKYYQTIGSVVKTGEELSQETDSELDDHIGVWFGEVDNGQPVVHTIPMEYVQEAEKTIVNPRYVH